MQVTIDATAGPRIRAYLQRRPPTAAEIARAGGFSRQYAWRVLAGRELPSKRFLTACEELGVPVAAILSGDGNGGGSAAA
jgi:transcriptional regulator with XRE-family HTH domain